MKIGYLAAFMAMTALFSSAKAEEVKIAELSAFKGKCLSNKGKLVPVSTNGWICKLPNGNESSFGSYGSTL